MTQRVPIPETASIAVSTAIRDPIDCSSSGSERCYPNVNAVIVTDTLGVVVDVNSLMCEMLGASPEELIGAPFQQLFSDPRRAEDAIRQVLAEERIVDYRLSLASSNGQTSVISFDAVTLRGSDKTLKGVLASARDISAQVRREELLQRRNEELEEQNRRAKETSRLKSEFLANMAHELRTPLNGIIGFSELMHDGKVGPVSDDHKEYLGDILTSARHLQQLINSVLDLARVESGKVDAQGGQVGVTSSSTAGDSPDTMTEFLEAAQ